MDPVSYIKYNRMVDGAQRAMLKVASGLCMHVCMHMCANICTYQHTKSKQITCTHNVIMVCLSKLELLGFEACVYILFSSNCVPSIVPEPKV